MFSLYPYWVLFGSSFLAATILPFSSEALLLLQLQQKYTVSALLLAASAGNVLGSVVNYYIGLKGSRFLLEKVIRMKEESIVRARERFKRYGMYSLLLAWVPVIGDPITVVAGMLRAPFYLFLLLVTVSKVGRYLFLIYAWHLW